MKLLGTTNTEGFTSHINEDDNGRVFFPGDADIDVDGSDNRHHDPFWQAGTTLRHNGHPIDTEAVAGIVVPPLIIRGVKGVVMGCKARVTNTRNGKTADAVVFDQGPSKKVGEISAELARRLGINSSPNTGGEDEPVIEYELWPGVPAVVDGVTYDLQPA